MCALRVRPMRLAVLAASVATLGAEHVGRCKGRGYMNVAWSGMSKEQCLQRAYEVNQGPGPLGKCGHVSYSASPGPQRRTNFCQCHEKCDKLDHLPPSPGTPGEQVDVAEWVTYVPSASAPGSGDQAESAQKSGSKQFTISVSIMIAVMFASVTATSVAMVLCRKCIQKRAIKRAIRSDVEANRLEQGELEQVSNRPGVVEAAVVAVIPSDDGNAPLGTIPNGNRP